MRLTIYLPKTPTGQYPGTPLTPLKINLLEFSKGLKIKQGWIATLINPCTPQAVSPQALWPPQNPQT